MEILYFVYLLAEILAIVILFAAIFSNNKVDAKITIIYPFLFILFYILIAGIYFKFKEDVDYREVLLASIGDTFDIFTLKFNKDLFALIKDENNLLVFDYILANIITLISYFAVPIAICKIHIANFFRYITKRKTKTYVFGSNKDSHTFINNVSEDSENKGKIVAVLNKNDENLKKEKEFLNSKKIPFITRNYKEKDKFMSLIKRLSFGSKDAHFLSFDEGDEDVHNFVFWSREYIEKEVEKIDKERLEKGKEKEEYILKKDGNNLYRVRTCYYKKTINVKFHVSVSPKQKLYVNENLFNSYSNNKYKDLSYGKIDCFNKYDLLSYNFILKNNFAKYVDYLLNDDGTLDKDAEINLYIIGYGKANRAILRDVLIETQFIKRFGKEGEYYLSPYRLNTTIFDFNEKLTDDELSNGFFKYDKKKHNQDNYYELCDDYISHITYKPAHVEEPFFVNDLYDKLREDSLNKNADSSNKKSAYFFIVSLGSDIENSHMARKLYDAFANLDSNIYIFNKVNKKMDVKVSNDSNCKIITFGDKGSVLTYEGVIQNKLISAAMKENIYYKRNETLSPEKEWEKLSRIKQISNEYSLLSIPFKLSLLKIKNVPSEEEFYAKYGFTSEINKNLSYIDRMKAACVKTDKILPLDVISYSEHEKWNAYEFSMGVLPMKKSMYKALGRSKSPNEKYHINITTEKGLIDYYNETGNDVIKYDYDIMDNFIKHSKNKQFFDAYIKDNIEE